MKPIMSVKVQRGTILNEYEPASHQLTDDGRAAFAARQKERMVRAQQHAVQTAAKVRTLTRGKG